MTRHRRPWPVARQLDLVGQVFERLGPECQLARHRARAIILRAENLMLPKLDAGDLIVGRAMGAYTWASASDFNFFPKATVVAVNETPGDMGSVSPFPL
jgi:hypothetical protein